MITDAVNGLGTDSLIEVLNVTTESFVVAFSSLLLGASTLMNLSSNIRLFIFR